MDFSEPAEARLVLSMLEHPAFAKDFGSLLAGDRLEAMWRDNDCIPEAWLLAREGGDVIGCGMVNTLPLADGTRQALVRLAVHPDWRRRGIGSALLGEIVERLRAVNDRGDAPLNSLVALFAMLPCDDAVKFAARHGFESVRHFHRMERHSTPVPEPQWPAGIVLRVFDGTAEMLAAWLAAYNVGMASHYRFRPGVLEDCRKLAAEPGFLPEHVQVAFSGRQPVGLIRISLHEEHPTRRGEVDILAVAPQHRGHGLGRALLRHGMSLLLAGGAGHIRLMVDADGAIAPALYRSEGFTTVSIRRHWERAL